MTRDISNNVRLAIITDVDHGAGIAYVKWLDQGTDGPSVPIPHPYAGRSGEGIFVGLQVGSIITLGMASYERYIPISVVPTPAYYSNDISGVSEAPFDAIGFPQIEEGDVVMQGVGGGQFRFNNDGNVVLTTAFGEGTTFSGDSNDSHRCSITIDSPVAYSISNAGLRAEGIVRRDVRINEGEDDFTDFLNDIYSEQALEEIGLDSQKQVIYMSKNPTAMGANKTEGKRTRNPGVMEKREILLECGRKWQVGNYDDELKRRQENSDVVPVGNYTDRSARRSTVLGLSLANPNELLEEVKGTLVDIFGNFIDINREIIPGPSGEKPEDFFASAMEKLRHTVALHVELNTRKGWEYGEEYDPQTKKPILLNDHEKPLFSSANNARDRSRWFVDVDKEGLTKINIPATSETGNIPVLARYETSSVIEVDNKGKPTGLARKNPKSLYRNEANKDIFLDQFGPGGIKILDDKEKPNINNRLAGESGSWVDDSLGRKMQPLYIEAGTAFHEITQTALTLLRENINIISSDMVEDDPPTPEEGYPAISSTIDPRVKETDLTPAIRDAKTGLMVGQPNAGGRSMQANLDGSLEMSIGANTIDRVSMVLDTAGAIVSRLGRDRFGRSIVMQTDGTIAIEVGGFDFIGESSEDTVDTRFVGRGDTRAGNPQSKLPAALPGDPNRFKSGKIVIRLRRSNADSSGPDENNDDSLLILDGYGMTIQSAGRLNLISKMDMTLESGSRIMLEAPKVQIYKDDPRFVSRNGRRI